MTSIQLANSSPTFAKRTCHDVLVRHSEPLSCVDHSEDGCLGCAGDGVMLCCVCGERPATVEYYWTRTQPEFPGPAVDELCEICAAMPCYSGGRVAA